MTGSIHILTLIYLLVCCILGFFPFGLVLVFEWHFAFTYWNIPDFPKEPAKELKIKFGEQYKKYIPCHLEPLLGPRNVVWGYDSLRGECPVSPKALHCSLGTDETDPGRGAPVQAGSALVYGVWQEGCTNP